MGKSPLRYKRLIKELPKHKSAQEALIASGFSENTARSQSKRVLNSALKYTAEEIVKGNESNGLSSKQLMSEIVGLSGSDVMNALKHIATQDKDLGSALKVLIPLAREHNVSLDSTDNHVTVPILNIVVDTPTDETLELESPSVIDGLTEPYVEG